MLISQSSGSGIPSDALGSLGDRYFDTVAQRWYLKRWVGQFSGTDRVEGAAFALSGSAPLRYDIRIKKFSSGTLLDQLVSNGITPNGMRIVTDDTYMYIGINSTGYTYAHGGLVIGKWLNISVTADGKNIKVFINGEQKFSVVDTTIPLLYGSGWVRAGDRSGSETSLHLCGGISVTQLDTSIKLLDWRFDAGSGTTIRDTSPSANNGTLTDGTPTNFWYQSWVPMDLL